jgi:hypothetical protein
MWQNSNSNFLFFFKFFFNKKLLFFLIIYSFSFVFSSNIKRIWIIRHCDKPKNKKNPCCSSVGFQRAEQWHHYFEKYFDSKSKIQIISSGYSENKNDNCILSKQNTNHPQCKKSQRMWVTANVLNQTLSKKFIVSKINCSIRS